MPQKRGAASRKGAKLPLITWATVPDAYADVPGSLIDVGELSLRHIAVLVKATVFGVTFRVQGSVDGTTYDVLTGQDNVGVARTPDVAVAAAAFAHITFSNALPAGAAACAFRFFKVQAKNTVGASVGTAAIAAIAK